MNFQHLSPGATGAQELEVWSWVLTAFRWANVWRISFRALVAGCDTFCSTWTKFTNATVLAIVSNLITKRSSFAWTTFRWANVWRISSWTIQTHLWRHGSVTVESLCTRLAWRPCFSCITFRTFRTARFRLFTFSTNITFRWVWLSTFRIVWTRHARSLLCFILILSRYARKTRCLPALLLRETWWTSNTRCTINVFRRTVLARLAI